jgi:hypothetical protein
VKATGLAGAAPLSVSLEESAVGWQAHSTKSSSQGWRKNEAGVMVQSKERPVSIVPAANRYAPNS